MMFQFSLLKKIITELTLDSRLKANLWIEIKNANLNENNGRELLGRKIKNYQRLR